MSYYTKITTAGLAAITSAINSNSKVPITYMAFGDGNGNIPEPNEHATSLVNEVYRVGVNKVEVHSKNPNWLVCEAIIPSAVGGFNIREVALYDNTGNTLLAIANYPPTYKPSVEEGAAKIQTIRIVIQVDNAGNFELIIDPDIVLATTQFVLDNTVPVEKKYPKVLGERNIQFHLIPSKGALRYGLNEPLPLDDALKNHFRGLTNKDAWADENIGIGSVSFGRNGASKAYLSTTFGHDCITYGTASIAGGAGSCTGNPDQPDQDAAFGYCAFAWGKDTKAQGRISNAMGQECESNSRYASTDGYKCIAGKSEPGHPDYTNEGSEGEAARAHGYDSQAYGNFAFAYGSFLCAYNGCQLIGKGVTSSKRGVGIGYGVDRPTIFAKEGDGQFAWVGFNTDVPLSKYDYRLGTSDTISYTLDAQGGPGTAVAFEVKGLLGDGSYASLHNVIVTHTNSGQPYGTVEYRLNGAAYLTVNQARNAKFFAAVEAGGAGFLVEGKRVVGGQLPKIEKLLSTATEAERNAKINEIIDGLTLHGLFAS